MCVKMVVEVSKASMDLPAVDVSRQVQLSKLFELKYGKEQLQDCVALAGRLGLSHVETHNLVLELDRRVLSQLSKFGYSEITPEGLELFCPSCVATYYLDKKNMPVPILFTDKEQGEIVCLACGHVVASSGDSDLVEQDESLPFDQQFKPSSDASANRGMGGTLVAYTKTGFSEAKGLEMFIKADSNLEYLNLSDFEAKHPELAARLLKGEPYAFGGEFVFRLRVYQKGPRQGLTVIDKLPFKEFDASGKSAFDCARVRVQKLTALLGTEAASYDDYLKMLTRVCGDYGIGSTPADKVFVDSAGKNVRRAVAFVRDWGFKVPKQVLVNTMFLLTCEQFGYDHVLLRCKNELKVHKGLRDAVLKISNIILDLQKMVDYA
jgi:hypothetical protein